VVSPACRKPRVGRAYAPDAPLGLFKDTYDLSRAMERESYLEPQMESARGQELYAFWKNAMTAVVRRL